MDTMNWEDHIDADPAVAGGRPVVRGTRLSVDLLLGMLADGATIEQLLESYPHLTRDGVRAVFAYASAMLSDEVLRPLPD